jgi:hypothetical protein
MFAVLPEQYSRGVYPSGIIGINPDGWFVLSKYEGTTAIRSAVQGVVYGDYALDSQTGKYQKVTGSGKYRSARSLAETDLETIETTIDGTVQFLTEEFDDLNTPENLFDALPEAIKSRFGTSSADIIEILNEVLTQYDLIEAVAAVKDISIPEAELEEVRAAIRTVELKDLITINRLFLSENYPLVCPAVKQTGDDVAFILPLLNCVIAGEGDDMPQTDDFSRAVSYSAYINKRNSIKDGFSKYKALELPKLPSLAKEWQSKPFATQLNIGIYGKIENNWGSSINFSVAAAAFIQVENAQIDLSKSTGEVSFFKEPPKIADSSFFPSILIGPVYLKITCPLEFDIVHAIGGHIQFTTKMFAGFTGLYGAETWVGANYGLKWKKILFVSVPVGFYFSPYAGGATISDYVYFFGPVDNSVASLMSIDLTNASVYAEVTPKIIFGPKLTVWETIYAQVAANIGIGARLDVKALPNVATLIKQNKLPFTGTSSLYLALKLDGTGGIDFNFGSIMGISLGRIKKELASFPIKSTVRQKLLEEKVF